MLVRSYANFQQSHSVPQQCISTLVLLSLSSPYVLKVIYKSQKPTVVNAEIFRDRPRSGSPGVQATLFENGGDRTSNHRPVYNNFLSRTCRSEESRPGLIPSNFCLCVFEYQETSWNLHGDVRISSCFQLVGGAECTNTYRRYAIHV